MIEGRFTVPIEARDLGIALPIITIGGLAQFDPAQVALEGAFVWRGLTVAVGGTFKRWSDYPGPLTETTMGGPAPTPPNFADTLVARVGAEYRWTWPTAHVAVRGATSSKAHPRPRRAARRTTWTTRATP
jgi:long-chain fatty acid transport protein